MASRVLVSGVLRLVLLLTFPGIITAQTIKVGNGTPTSCTESALSMALAQAQTLGGATIKFRCGKAPAVIETTDLMAIPDNTTIDGEGLITLHTEFFAGAVFVEDGATVVLKGLTLSNDNSSATWNMGRLTVVDTVFRDSGDGAFGCGGGIHNLGDLTVRRSSFVRNRGGFAGGAICNVDPGHATIRHSMFEDNTGGGGGNGGGAIWNSGIMTVSDTTFAHNSGFFDFGGGAIHNEGDLTVKASIFFQNHAGAGGAILNDGGDLEIRRSVIIENAAVNGSVFAHQGRGGGILNVAGTARIVNSTIADNTAVNGGGGIYTCCGGTTDLRHSDVSGNFPDDILTDP